VEREAFTSELARALEARPGDPRVEAEITIFYLTGGIGQPLSDQWLVARRHADPVASAAVTKRVSEGDAELISKLLAAGATDDIDANVDLSRFAADARYSDGLRRDLISLLALEQRESGVALLQKYGL
jgi:hypothetical protein